MIDQKPARKAAAELPPGSPRAGEADTPGAPAVTTPWCADAAQRERLVERYAHLVKYVVGRLGVAVPGVFDHEDAMQAGAIGLLQAIDGYRPEAAASFESYALLRIRGAILDAVRSIDTVGRAGREAARAIERAMSELYTSLGRVPHEREVADRLGIPIERYHERLQAASVVTVSLDTADERDGSGESSALAESIADEGVPDPAQWMERRDDVARLSSAVAGLGERQKLVLSLYYQDELTLREIGAVLGVTESRVCQIHAETLLALRVRLGGSPARQLPRRRVPRHPQGGSGRPAAAARDQAVTGHARLGPATRVAPAEGAATNQHGSVARPEAWRPPAIRSDPAARPAAYIRPSAYGSAARAEATSRGWSA